MNFHTMNFHGPFDEVPDYDDQPFFRPTTWMVSLGDSKETLDYGLIVPDGPWIPYSTNLPYGSVAKMASPFLYFDFKNWDEFCYFGFADFEYAVLCFLVIHEKWEAHDRKFIRD